MAKTDEEVENKNLIVETDADIDAIDNEIDESDGSEDSEVVSRRGGKGDVEIGGYAAHLASAKKGMFDYKIWPNLTVAVVSMAAPNLMHRIDLRDRETLERLEKDLEQSIDHDYVAGEMLKKPWLTQARGTFAVKADKTKDANTGKPLTKKALKANAKRDKIQAKIDIIKAKISKIKNKKGPRVDKLRATLDELVTKRDRVV
jgi:hypothetical protein